MPSFFETTTVNGSNIEKADASKIVALRDSDDLHYVRLSKRSSNLQGSSKMHSPSAKKSFDVPPKLSTMQPEPPLPTLNSSRKSYRNLMTRRKKKKPCPSRLVIFHKRSRIFRTSVQKEDSWSATCRACGTQTMALY